MMFARLQTDLSQAGRRASVQGGAGANEMLISNLTRDQHGA